MKSDLIAATHYQRPGSLSWQKSKQHGHCPILKISIVTVSTTFELDLGQLTGNWLQTSNDLVLTDFEAKNNAIFYMPHLENERQWSINYICSFILGNLACN
jgi:hypothetical protein